MSGTASRVVDWLSDVADDDESLVSWATLGHATSPDSSGTSRAISEYIVERGLQPDAQVGQGHTQMFAILTNRRLILTGVGGLMKLRPKRLVLDVPIETVRLEWWDQREVGPDQRFLLFLWGTEWFRHSGAIDKRSNVEAFTAALGDRAARVR